MDARQRQLGPRIAAAGKTVLRCTLSSYASVVFSRSQWSGVLLFLASLQHPMRAAAGLLATLVANAFAAAMGYSKERIQSGYYGYNALLFGLFLVHESPLSTFLVLGLLAGAVVSAMLSAGLGDALAMLGLPLLPLPFVILASLLGHTTLELAVVPPWLTTASDLPPTLPLAETSIFGVSKCMLEGLGAIAFAPTGLAGGLVLAAALVYSRITGLGLIFGALLGQALLAVLGRADANLALPVQYNAALTFAAVASVFRLPSLSTLGLAAFATWFGAWLTTAWLVPFAPVSLPVLAWPFVLTTLLVLRALASAPARASLAPLLLPHGSPEANLNYRDMLAERLGVPGPARFWLPVEGHWTITQGEHGLLTHREPWAHALDFEILDGQGFPFRGDGTRLEDYYCFGQPALAAGTGTVVFAEDTQPDNQPGHQDLQLPYGNVVIIQHGEGLYSVLAHLRRGSLTVKAGDFVVVGQVVGACGASGRSPRPHLHFQVQASPWLGAPTIPFGITHYTARHREPTLALPAVSQAERLHRLGVPREGETVRQLRPDAPATAGVPAFPGRGFELSMSSGACCSVRSEVAWNGEQSLVSEDGKARLYFVQNQLGLVFTTYQGSWHHPLGILFQCLPALPRGSSARVAFSETLPASSFMPPGLRVIYDFFRVFGQLVSIRVDCECVHLPEPAVGLVVTSEIDWRVLGRSVRRRIGRVEFDALGIISVESWTSRRLSRFSARRIPATFPVEASLGNATGSNFEKVNSIHE
ncbi:MAG TPA: urea transporter [Polyangiaceae bacterium]|nr:urea transporter [Polyangiaceae bacterium]